VGSRCVRQAAPVQAEGPSCTGSHPAGGAHVCGSDALDAVLHAHEAEVAQLCHSAFVKQHVAAL
jgi:hypothetical protein